MTLLALILILVAAVAHASWNFLLKKTGGGIGFVWLFASLAALLYAPLAFWFFLQSSPQLGWIAFWLIVASAVIHTVYFLMLDRGYRYGDLSVVYPVARSTGPLITIVAAILFLGERPGPVALVGAAAIIGGAFYMSGAAEKLRSGAPARGMLFALLTGCTIAAYTICDRQAVAWAMVPPVLLHWGESFGRVILLAPLALRERGAVARAWRDHKGAAFAAAILSPLAYILVLVAMTFTPVSYVAPAREISILFGALLGTQVLGEADARRRMIAAALMTAGVVALALG